MDHNCKICSVTFQGAPDDLILCKHNAGFVHMGCCINRCSQNGKPCEHAASRYGLKKV